MLPEGGFEPHDVAMLCVKVGLGINERFEAGLGCTVESVEDRLTGRGKGGRVGDDDGRPVTKLASENGGGFVQDAVADFQSARVAGGFEGFSQGGSFG